jgi:hypothetical protein
MQTFFVDHLVRNEFTTLLYLARTSSIVYDTMLRSSTHSILILA